ncbi:MAG: hypothetical protein SFW36_21930 [Leptolyngbyaceae cyanobacterium bins.59]|nr:hypothetical protein [Leptolyngbyaceae cyanobacterium bins.59]
MYRTPPQGHIRPKISSMPRPKSEPSTRLDVYKLVVEKKRLQQELQKIDQRREIILARLKDLNTQIQTLDKNIEQMQDETAKSNPAEPSHASTSTDSPSFKTLTLDY